MLVAERPVRVSAPAPSPKEGARSCLKPVKIHAKAQAHRGPQEQAVRARLGDGGELLIFVTPRIIGTVEDGTRLSREFEDRVKKLKR